MKPKLTVEICMGSSCYSRGNSESLGIIEQFCEENDISAEIAIKGCLCMNVCAKGPTLIINGQTFNGVNPACVADLLKFNLRDTAKQ